jgi:rhodanese-related sulfurtransferase
MSLKRCSTIITFSLALLGFPILYSHAQHMTVVPEAPRTTADSLHLEMDKGKKILIVDVRVPAEFAKAHIPDALNIPLENFEREFAALHVPKATTVVTVCDKGGRSSHAVVLLEKLGYSASSYCTLESWKTAGYGVESGGAQHSASPSKQDTTREKVTKKDAPPK